MCLVIYSHNLSSILREVADEILLLSLTIWLLSCWSGINYGSIIYGYRPQT